MAAFRPLKMKGTANGSRMRQSSVQRLALQARPSSISSGGTDTSPEAIESTSGKKATRNVTTTRGSSLVPRTTTRIGARATLGIAWVSTSSGYTAAATSGEEVRTTASGRLTRRETRNPRSTVLVVTNVCQATLPGSAVVSVQIAD